MEFPDAISLDNLTALQDKAPQDVDSKLNLTSEEIWDIAVDHVQGILEQIPDPVAHKALALASIKFLGEYHKDISEKLFEEDSGGALAWSRDVGFLQSAHSLIVDVNVGEYDFMVRNQ